MKKNQLLFVSEKWPWKSDWFWQSLIILTRYMKKNLDAFLNLHFSYDSNLKLTLTTPIIIDWKLFRYLSNNFMLCYLIGFYQAISDNFRMLLYVFDKENLKYYLLKAIGNVEKNIFWLWKTTKMLTLLGF